MTALESLSGPPLAYDQNGDPFDPSEDGACAWMIKYWTGGRPKTHREEGSRDPYLLELYATFDELRRIVGPKGGELLLVPVDDSGNKVGKTVAHITLESELNAQWESADFHREVMFRLIGALEGANERQRDTVAMVADQNRALCASIVDMQRAGAELLGAANKTIRVANGVEALEREEIPAPKVDTDQLAQQLTETLKLNQKKGLPKWLDPIFTAASQAFAGLMTTQFQAMASKPAPAAPTPPPPPPPPPPEPEPEPQAEFGDDELDESQGEFEDDTEDSQDEFEDDAEETQGEFEDDADESQAAFDDDSDASEQSGLDRARPVSQPSAIENAMFIDAMTYSTGRSPRSTGMCIPWGSEPSSPAATNAKTAAQTESIAAPAPVTEPDTTSVAELAVTEPDTAFVAEPGAGTASAADSDADSRADFDAGVATATVAEPDAEPVADAGSVAHTATIAEPDAAPVADAGSVAATASVAELDAESVAELDAEPVAELDAEPVAEPDAAPIVDSSASVHPAPEWLGRPPERLTASQRKPQQRPPSRHTAKPSVPRHAHQTKEPEKHHAPDETT